jgi:predicted aspartyl protease
LRIRRQSTRTSIPIYQGATLWVSLGFDPAWRKATNAPPKAGITHVEALIDTGAEECCIDNLLAAQLGLIPIDRRMVCGVGSMEVDVYLGQIHVQALKFTISGRFAGVPLEENGHRQRVLIGRTFLRYCKLVYDGTSGDVTIQLGV